MNRRQFLRLLAGATAAAGGFALESPFRPRFRIAEAALGKTVVLIFQRGGCDGLNVVVPYGEDEYYNLRPTIGIAPPSAGDPESAIDLDGFFGLHPALASLQGIYNSGDLAVLPAVHYPQASRSHFDSQHYIESAIKASGYDGWLNRHLGTAPQSAELRAVGFGNDLPQSLRGNEVVSSFSSIANFNLGLSPSEEAELLPRLAEVYGQPAGSQPYASLIHDFGRTTLNDLSVVNALVAGGYTPANGAVYPNSSYGRQLRETAQMIKQGTGLEVATLSIGGWDTHSRQGGGEANGSQARRLREFAEGINAFYTDLGPAMADVILMTMTEFGRTSRENGSMGTDHGNASSWFVAGSGINGGVYTGGGWPGLAEAQLNNGRYLEMSVDYRDLYAEVLTGHLANNNVASVIPGYTPSPVGILNA